MQLLRLIRTDEIALSVLELDFHHVKSGHIEQPTAPDLLDASAVIPTAPGGFGGFNVRDSKRFPDKTDAKAQ